MYELMEKSDHFVGSEKQRGRDWGGAASTATQDITGKWDHTVNM